MNRSRFLVLLVSAPIIVLIVVGGFLSHASAREGSYQHLRVFEDVVSLILNNYVEEVNAGNVMRGAMHGLADGLDPDSAYVPQSHVATLARPQAPGKGDVGLELTRQYLLRVIAARDGSPAARAGIRTGDFIRMIDEKPTRDLSVLAGSRLLRGAPGTRVKLTVIRSNAAEPHDVELIREERRVPAMAGSIIKPRIGLVRVPAFGDDVASRLKERLAALKQQGADHAIIDLRGTAEGSLESGFTAARLFVASGVLGIHQSRTTKSPITARAGDGTITVPLTLLVNGGTAGAAELFAAALSGTGRASLVGERTTGRVGMQELVMLPDGSALWLTTSRYLTSKDVPIHEKGLTPEVVVESPDVEFGTDAPIADPVLEKAIELVSSPQKQAA
jgi:carboxyl-terminal processing protease